MAVAGIDILLLGRSGQGKTTLAKKLIDPDNAVFKISIQFGAGGGHLYTNKKNNIRVLDPPGFSGPEYQGNLHVIDCIGKAQAEHQLKFNRIVYFIPGRGPLEKADGSMQEELKLLSYYFGKQLFDGMVVVATNPSKQRYQQAGFDDEEIELTKRVFHSALKSAVSEDIICPPVLYIGLNSTPIDTLQTIMDTSVIKKGFVLTTNRPNPSDDEFVLVEKPTMYSWLPSWADITTWVPGALVFFHGKAHQMKQHLRLHYHNSSIVLSSPRPSPPSSQ